MSVTDVRPGSRFRSVARLGFSSSAASGLRVGVEIGSVALAPILMLLLVAQQLVVRRVELVCVRMLVKAALGAAGLRDGIVADAVRCTAAALLLVVPLPP